VALRKRMVCGYERRITYLADVLIAPRSTRTLARGFPQSYPDVTAVVESGSGASHVEGRELVGVFVADSEFTSYANDPLPRHAGYPSRS